MYKGYGEIIPMVRWYVGLKGRRAMGSVVSQFKLGRGVMGGKVYDLVWWVSRSFLDMIMRHTG